MEDGYLIVQLLVEEREPARVAHELDVSQVVLLDELHHALEDLAIFYVSEAGVRAGRISRA